LTNKNSVNLFFSGDERIKILIQLDFNSHAVISSKFFNLIEPLRKFECKLGIAVKSVSEKCDLTIRVKDDEVNYDIKEEIPYILSVIGATVGVGEKNEILFYSMNAELLNSSLPFTSEDQFLDINYLIKQLICYKSIIIAHSRLDTLNFLTRNDDKWRFFIPIDAKETSYSAIKNLLNLINTSSLKGVEWVIGNTDIPNIRSTGFLFVVKNCRVIAVCLDDFDLILLREKFTNKSEQDLEIISPNNLRYSFYPERAKTSEIIIKSIELYSHKSLDIKNYGLNSFEEDVNENLAQALEIACFIHYKEEINLIGSIAKQAMKEFNVLIDIFSKIGYSITEKKFYGQVMSETSKSFLVNSVQNILKDIDPLSTKIDIAKQLLNQQNIEIDSVNIDELINDIKNDPICPDDLRENINVPSEIDISAKISHLKKYLGNYENNQNVNSAFFHTKMLHLLLINGLNFFQSYILKEYINRITLNVNVFPSARSEFLKDLDEKLYNQLIIDLSKYSYGVKYYILHECMFKRLFRSDKQIIFLFLLGLRNYSCSMDSIAALDKFLMRFLDWNLFSEKNWRELWHNNRFGHLIRTFIEDQRILYKLSRISCSTETPIMPLDIAQKIQKIREDENEIELPSIITSFVQFIDLLKVMRRREQIPDNFRKILLKSIEINKNLYYKLDELNILRIFKYQYNQEKGVFPEAIQLNNIVEAVEHVEKFLEESSSEKSIDVSHYDIKFKRESSLTDNQLDAQTEKHFETNRNIEVHEKFKHVYGERFNLMNSSEFNCLSMILDKPVLPDVMIDQIVVRILPYIIQKLKMWGCNALTADNISSLIRTQQSANVTLKDISNPDNRLSFRKKASDSLVLKAKSIQKDRKISISRIDTIVGIMNFVDPIVGQDILTIMTKFPMSLPLIIRELHEENSFKVIILKE
jgi:hypothetical protein